MATLSFVYLLLPFGLNPIVIPARLSSTTGHLLPPCFSLAPVITPCHLPQSIPTVHLTQ